MAVQVQGEERETAMSISTRLFKDLLARWASGVTVVTVRADDVVHGMTVSAFASVSADPPLVLVCLYRGTRTREHLVRQGRFAVNILSAEQQQIAERFAGRRPAGESPFSGVDWRSESGGCPIIEGAAAHLECEVESSYEAGTHTIVVGRVTAATIDETAEPLLYWARDFRCLEPIAEALRDAA